MALFVVVCGNISRRRDMLRRRGAWCFEGAPGEQWTCFFKDPSGNNLEFKHMSKPQNLFAKYNVAEG